MKGELSLEQGFLSAERSIEFEKGGTSSGNAVVETRCSRGGIQGKIRRSGGL